MGSLWFKMSVDHSRPGSKLPYKSFATLAFVITGGRYKSLSWWSNASTIISYIFLDYTIQNASRRFAGSVSDTWFPSGMKVFKRNISQSIPTHGSTSSERLTNWQQGNKTSNHRVRCTMSIDVDRCRSMSYDVLCALETSCSLKIILLSPYCTSQLTKCNSADVVSVSPAAAFKTVQSNENSSESKKLTHAMQKERLQCNPQPVLHNGLHTWPPSMFQVALVSMICAFR